MLLGYAHPTIEVRAECLTYLALMLRGPQDQSEDAIGQKAMVALLS